MTASIKDTNIYSPGFSTCKSFNGNAAEAIACMKDRTWLRNSIIKQILYTDIVRGLIQRQRCRRCMK
jgi:hypothetical protein